MRTFIRKEALNAMKERDLKMIFNHAVEEMDLPDTEGGIVLDSTTQRYTMVTLMKSWMDRFRCLYALYDCALSSAFTSAFGSFCTCQHSEAVDLSQGRTVVLNVDTTTPATRWELDQVSSS